MSATNFVMSVVSIGYYSEPFMFPKEIIVSGVRRGFESNGVQIILQLTDVQYAKFISMDLGKDIHVSVVRKAVDFSSPSTFELMRIL